MNINNKYINKDLLNTPKKNIFTGKVSAGNTIQMNTTWDKIGKFNKLLVEVLDETMNGHCVTSLDYNLIFGDKGKFRAINAFAPVYLDAGISKIHTIPNSNFKSNTIKFDSYGSYYITNLWIVY